uniref:Uncharacterized protein n=1 Tax=Zea mays TaxID=4577 RepID=A0A804MBD3_MAIZE
MRQIDLLPLAERRPNERRLQERGFRRLGSTNQHLHRRPHGRPLPRVRVAARQCQPHRAVHLRRVKLADQRRVGGVLRPPFAVEPPRPVHNVHGRLPVPASLEARLVVVVRALHGAARSPPADHLQDEHPEREHVRVEAGAAGEEAFVRHVPAGARHRLRRVVRRAVTLYDAGQAEVAQPRLVLAVHHHVAGLHVPVEDPLAAPVVQVVQRRRHTADDPVPPLPCQLRRRLRRRRRRITYCSGIGVQVPVQAAHGEVLVDKQQLASFVAPSHELHEVTVRQLADRVHLRHELLLPAIGVATRHHPLHGHVHAHPLQVAKVHGAEAASAELTVRAEVGRSIS